MPSSDARDPVTTEEVLGWFRSVMKKIPTGEQVKKIVDAVNVYASSDLSPRPPSDFDKIIYETSQKARVLQVSLLGMRRIIASSMPFHGVDSLLEELDKFLALYPPRKQGSPATWPFYARFLVQPIRAAFRAVDPNDEQGKLRDYDEEGNMREYDEGTLPTAETSPFLAILSDALTRTTGITVHPGAIAERVKVARRKRRTEESNP